MNHESVLSLYHDLPLSSDGMGCVMVVLCSQRDPPRRRVAVASPSVASRVARRRVIRHARRRDATSPYATRPRRHVRRVAASPPGPKRHVATRIRHASPRTRPRRHRPRRRVLRRCGAVCRVARRPQPVSLYCTPPPRPLTLTNSNLA
jgi:hypothetical protein